MSKENAYIVISPTADLREEPGTLGGVGRRDSQLLLGEIFDVEGRDGNFFQGRSRHDGYKGYIALPHLMPLEGRATHFVDNHLAIIHNGADIKAGHKMNVSFMSRLEIDKDSLRNGFVRACGLGWIPEHHVKPLSDLKKRIDHVSVALRFMGTPYRYGGRSALGIDCSGLTQVALTRAGFSRIPRDADMQEKSKQLGPIVQDAQRGDVVFFRGHVGLMIDDQNIISATEKYAGVVVETLDELAKRQGGVTAIRRPALKP